MFDPITGHTLFEEGRLSYLTAAHQLRVDLVTSVEVSCFGCLYTTTTVALRKRKKTRVVKNCWGINHCRDTLDEYT